MERRRVTGRRVLETWRVRVLERAGFRAQTRRLGSAWPEAHACSSPARASGTTSSECCAAVAVPSRPTRVRVHTPMHATTYQASRLARAR